MFYFVWFFTNFCEKNNINLILCTVGDHRSNGVVERLIYTVKAKLLAMSFNDPKPSLNTAIDKIIWNIRSTKQSSIGCCPFSKHFNRSPNTFWKSLVSHAISLDKGKSILTKDRAQDWGGRWRVRRWLPGRQNNWGERLWERPCWQSR